jgi:hypothetical protein
MELEGVRGKLTEHQRCDQEVLAKNPGQGDEIHSFAM